MKGASPSLERMGFGGGVVLALDTSTPDLSVAVCGADLGEAVRITVGNRMGAAIAPAVNGLMSGAGLARSDLTAIAVGAGPGPYTSLRVGLMFARAAAWALGIPVLAACSLDIVARGVTGGVAAEDRAQGSPFGVALDARRREVYWACYDAEGRRTAGPLVAAPAAIEAEAVRWYGPGMPSPTAEGGAVVTDRGGPDALVLAEWVRASEARGHMPEASENLPEAPGKLPEAPSEDIRWPSSDDDGSGAAWIPQTLLPPLPLYLRRPDAKVPSWLT